ncbi:MAG: HlyD family efflux transporter periplasmic adaptor subunit, partial [Pseudomonadota bacterium]
SAAARVEELEAELSECQVFAPFSGRVLKQTKRPFELVKPGEAFLEITDQETLEIIAMVPSLILPQVSRQTRFTVRLDETGKDYQADVQRIGAGVDPLSRSVRIVSVFKERPAGVVPGMSGTAIFPAGR